MELRPEIQLQSAIKALVDVVIPAVDPANKMAQEQVRLVLATLQAVSTRLPIGFRYDRHELVRLVALADTLREDPSDGPEATAAGQQLRIDTNAGRSQLEDGVTDPAAVRETAKRLRAAISGFVRAMHDDGAVARRSDLRKVVMAAAKEQLDRERAWCVLQGFEDDPSALAPLETLLDPIRN